MCWPGGACHYGDGETTWLRAPAERKSHLKSRRSGTWQQVPRTDCSCHVFDLLPRK